MSIKTTIRIALLTTFLASGQMYAASNDSTVNYQQTALQCHSQNMFEMSKQSFTEFVRKDDDLFFAWMLVSQSFDYVSSHFEAEQTSKTKS